ncbi:MAG: hypothetical protein LBM87_00670 [Ruminococcus sp.]|jgi:hypothetical protein|nr:hypothetical protein [Ruminococcus sp.]
MLLIEKFVLPILATITSTGLIFMAKQLYSTNKANKLLIKSCIHLLSSSIIDFCNEAMYERCLTVSKVRRAKQLFTDYKKLGGTDDLDNVYEHVLSFPYEEQGCESLSHQISIDNQKFHKKFDPKTFLPKSKIEEKEENGEGNETL